MFKIERLEHATALAVVVHTLVMKYIINTDGGSRGNPGRAAAAFIIRDCVGKKIKQQGFYLGMATNNEAEYQAVVNALEFLTQPLSQGSKIEVEIKSDSQLVVKQLSDEWKIKDTRMRGFYNKIKELETKIGKVSYSYIPRTQNSEADLVVNMTLDNLPSYL